MNPDPQFPWWILSNAIGSFAAGVAVLIACTATKKLSRAIARWRTSKLPKGPDAERAREELEGLIDELDAAERAELAVQLLLRSAALSREIAECARERSEEQEDFERAQLEATEALISMYQNYPLAATIRQMKRHEGKTDDEVAAELHCSPASVRFYNGVAEIFLTHGIDLSIGEPPEGF